MLQKIVQRAAVGMLLASVAAMAAPSATEILAKAREYRATLSSYAFKAALYEDVVGDGKVIETIKTDVDAKVKRPDKLRVEVKNKYKDRTSYLNNGLFTMVDHGYGYYGQLKTPKEIDKALDFIFNKYGINAPLAAFLYTHMEKRTHFTKGKYFGTREIGGVACDYVAFRSKGQELHLWIARGEKPLVINFVLIDLSSSAKPKTSASLKWDTDVKFSDSIFTFVPSKGLHKIEVEPAN